MELQFSQYQHHGTPVPSTDKVYSALRYRNIDPLLGRRHEYTGSFPHEVMTSGLGLQQRPTSQTQRLALRCQQKILDVCWWAHVSNAEVLQRSGLSTIGDILRHRRLYRCLAMLHVWTLEYQHMMFCV